MEKSTEESSIAATCSPATSPLVQLHRAGSARRSWLNLSDQEKIDWLAALPKKQPKFRYKQIDKWIFHKRVTQFDQMTDLPVGLREALEAEFWIFNGKEVRAQKSADGTEKILVEFPPTEKHAAGQIECVLIREKSRRTICVSSQVGCAMGCVFCASGLDGVDRNLTAAEIQEQMLRLSMKLPEEERISHIVMMGMGEPLANLDNVLESLDRASSNEGLGISPRRITISTVGLPKAIDRLTRTGLKYQLAISLHAPNDEDRDHIVPVNDKVGIDRLMESADRFQEATGRRLTFEYVLLAGVNDSEGHARQLIRLFQGRDAMLNIIPYNPVDGLPYQTPSATALAKFRKVLEDNGVVVKCRQRKGDEIDAACGQLRRKTNSGGSA